MSNKNINKPYSKASFSSNGIKTFLYNTEKNSNEKKEINNLYNSIGNIVQQYLLEIKKFNNELNDISKLEDINKKEEELLRIEKILSDKFDIYEYLSNPDSEVIKKVGMIESFRHNYYILKNNILSIKSEIMIDKLDRCDKKINRISSLESKFENLGGTMISIILSISIIVTAITAIEKLDIENVLLFVVCLVWFGMTFLLFVHYLFSDKEKQNKGAIILYTVITLLMIMLIGYSCKDTLIGQLNILINS